MAGTLSLFFSPRKFDIIIRRIVRSACLLHVLQWMTFYATSMCDITCVCVYVCVYACQDASLIMVIVILRNIHYHLDNQDNKDTLFPRGL